MPILDTERIPVIEKLPGWRGRLFHSSNLTFGHWDFSAGSSIHEHFHLQEEVWEVLEGELELTIGGAVDVVRPGIVAIVPANVPHSARALSDGKAIVVDHPLRTDFR
jgi:quercetin dioxygenase-like cupin family protein